MKKFRLFLMTSLMLGVVACSSDNDGELKVEKMKTVTIELERTGDFLTFIEDKWYIEVANKKIDYSKAEWGNLIDNGDGIWIIEKMFREPSAKWLFRSDYATVFGQTVPLLFIVLFSI